MLTFLQLSDIHFRGGDLTDRDGNPLDYDFREQLVTDARQVGEAIGGFSGVLICGDIADSGAGSEFGQATEWLQNLCAAIGVDPWLVWVVPGNHDVDRTSIADRQLELRRRLRECEIADLDQTFERILAHATESEAMLEPLHNYLAFATAFNCAFGQDPYWSERLELSAPGTLEIRGVNSALICGKGDDCRAAPMVIGERQATVIVAHGTVHYTLCHHPESWLRDGPTLKPALDRDVHVQVTGHRHERNLHRSARGIHLEAGAVSPDRNADGTFPEPRIPRYEMISLDTVEQGDELCLDLIVRGRLWSEEHGWVLDSGEHGNFARRYRLALADDGTDLAIDDSARAARIERPELELRYRLARLQPYDRNQCAIRIEAPLQEILGGPEYSHVGELLAWAEANSRLPQLWDAVMDQAQVPQPPSNPFSS